MLGLSSEERRHAIVAGVCFGSLLVYYGLYWWRRIVIGKSSTPHIRRAWIQETIESQEDSLLVVQTMRNLIIAATLIVTGIAQILGRLVIVLTKPPKPHPGTLITPEGKVTLAVALLFFSMVMLAFSVRLAVHLSFMIPLKSRLPRAAWLRRRAGTAMARCTWFFSAGLRLLVASFPVLGWVAGDTLLVVCTVLVLMLTISIDSRFEDGGDDMLDFEVPEGSQLFQAPLLCDQA